MLNLLVKDFKLMFTKDKRLSKRILSTLFTIFFMGCFVIIEVYFFSAILTEIKDVRRAPLIFMTLFLFVMSLVLIVTGIFQAMKLFFNKKDLEQLSTYPVTNAQVICSKLIFLFISHYISSIIFVYPLFVAYGQIMYQTTIFYYIGIFYPVFTFFIEVGIALLLVYPFWLLLQYLKKRPLIQFIVSIVVLLIGVILYSIILIAFIDIVKSGEITSLFNSSNINSFEKFRKFQIPINFLAEAFINKRWSRLFPFLLIALGVFMAGVTITIFAFNYVKNVTFDLNKKGKEKKYKQVSQTKALIRKEIMLLTKSSDYIFSFSGLLIVQPILLYLILYAINSIFTTDIFLVYSMAIPNLIPLIDVLLIMMFTLIISQGASQYIDMEKRTIKIVKTIPVKPFKQLAIKMMIPFTLSFTSLVVSLLVLLISGTLSFVTFIFAFILTTVLLFIFNLLAMREELNIRHSKPRSTYMSSVYSYLLPFAYIIVAIVLSFFGLPVFVSYIAGLVIILLLGLPNILYLKKNYYTLFMDLEAVN